ncbi:DUF6868 family protein [Neptunicella sp. SCSIO 80796]|uniref:DUF6868 family protein n=1 Tax=Neptunicella plasticusilytica TaxID=3117012 RepID=UPI003A4DDB68
MNDIDNLITFFGWCTVVNIAVLLFATIVLATFGTAISKLHSKMFNMRQDALHTVYMQYLSHYKLAIFMLNLTPYIALKILNL